MKPSISKYERRDYCKWPEGKPVEAITLLLICLALAVIATVIFPFVPTVGHAEQDINYQDVHSSAAACAYAELYPEKVKNLKELKKNCI